MGQAAYQLETSSEVVAPPESSDERLANYTQALSMWTALLAIVAALELFYIIRQERWLKQSVDAANSSAQAAKQSADAAVTAQRAWLRVEVEPSFDWNITPLGLTVVVNITARNIGKSPATRVWPHITIVAPQRDESPLAYNSRISKAKALNAAIAKQTISGRTVFPGEEFSIGWNLTFQRNEFDQAVRVDESGRKTINTYITGTVAYHFAGGEGQTPFIFKADESGPPGRAMLAHDRVIPKADISLFDLAMWDAE